MTEMGPNRKPPPRRSWPSCQTCLLPSRFLSYPLNVLLAFRLPPLVPFACILSGKRFDPTCLHPRRPQSLEASTASRSCDPALVGLYSKGGESTGLRRGSQARIHSISLACAQAPRFSGRMSAQRWRSLSGRRFKGHIFSKLGLSVCACC